MRPTLRTTATSLATMAATLLAILATAAPASAEFQLYGGLYSTDVSSSAPTGLAPANGTVLSYPNSPISLAWRSVAGATSYQVSIARQESSSADCTSTTAFQADNIVVTATTTQTGWVPDLQEDATGAKLWTGTYCWRVRVLGDPNGEWSNPNRFTRTWTSTPTGLKFYNDHDGPIPRTSASADYATGSTVTRNAGYLEWTAVAGAASYEVEVSTSQSFSPASVISERHGLSDSRVTLLHLPDDTYYWRVRAKAPNGTEGPWSSGTNSFTVRWLDETWSDTSKLWPADSSAQSEIRLGWTPMPGATHYEYQLGTTSGCFWDDPAFAPYAYGHWTNKPPVFDSLTGALQGTWDPLPTHCRLSDIGATTINNWVTIQNAIGEDAWANIRKDCITDQGDIECEPAGLPDSVPDDWGAGFHGGAEMNGPGAGDGRSGDGRYGDAYQLYWRVRPVYHVEGTSETGWDISDGGFDVYGSWTKYTGGGANRHHKFTFDPGAAVTTSTGTRCEGAYNPAGGCVDHTGSSMQADESPAVTVDRTMQFPVLTWKPFDNAYSGYQVQIARDPLFNNIAHIGVVGAPYQYSYALKDSLSDNSEGTGYWWRVVPCAVEEEGGPCLPVYAAASVGLPVSYGLSGGYSDNAVAQTFTKSSAMQTAVTANFESSAPLIRWARRDIASTDYVGWSRGLEGAAYYQVELARDPFFSQEKISLNTTIPRIVPFSPAEGEGEVTPLPDGLWYYRVRAVDRTGLEGAWSETSSFNKRITAPYVSVSGGGPREGDGVTVSWSPVVGATSYDVQWSTDYTFEDPGTTATTLQPAYYIPATRTGTFYWRVRSTVNGIAGQWSEAKGPITIVAPTTLKYALNRTALRAKQVVTIYGQLNVAGSPTNGKTVQLLKKTTGCESRSGSYNQIGERSTGVDTDDGMVIFRSVVRTNGCYRLAWISDSSVVYSAPFSVKARPIIGFRVARRSILRGRSMCATITANTPIYGRVRIQYDPPGRVGWTTAKTAMMRGTRKVQCAGLARAGKFPVRVFVDRMTTSDWKKFEDTARGGGYVKVKDSWRIVR